MQKYILKDATMVESGLEKIYKYPINPIDSKIHSDKAFVNIDNGFQGGTHWCCFIIKENKSYYFRSFGGQPDKFLQNQLPTPKTYHKYKIQDINSIICGSYCFYFFYLFERMKYYDTISKMYFVNE